MTSFCADCGSNILQKTEAFDLNVPVAPKTLARYLKLLKTNEPPAGPELAYILSVVSKTGARLTCLDDEISRLKIQLKELEEECAVLSDYHNQNTSILSPLRRMPPEVLGQIFLWTQPSLDDASDRGWSDVKYSPWILTHINRRWRAIALSIPTLWSLVCIDYSDERPYPLDMIRTQIQRARTLKIHFFGCQERDSSPQMEMFKLLSERSSLWEELSLRLTSSLFPLLATLRDRVQLLRRVCLRWDNQESQEGVESINCFQTAVSLVDIDVSSVHRFVPTLLPMYHQLMRYDLDAPWDTHFEVLKSLPNLVEGRIRVNFDEEPWPDANETIDLLHLRHLYLSDVEVLNYLRAPALDEIAIHTMGEESPDICTYVEPFVLRSACTLQNLCLRGLPDAQAVLQILQKCPSIDKIAIIIAGPGDDEDTECDALNTFFTQFTVPNSTGSAAMAPQLCGIFFGCQHSRHVNYPLYLAMLESRWNAEGCALKGAALFLVNPGPHLAPATCSGLNALWKAGLAVGMLSGEAAQRRMDTWLYISSWT